MMLYLESSSHFAGSTKIRTWNLRVGALALAILFSLGGLSPMFAQQARLNVGYIPASDIVPLFVAKERGFFEKRNVDATLTRIGLAPNIAAAIISGDVQIGMGTAPVFIQGIQGGLDLVAVSGATRMKKDNPFAGLVVRSGLNLKSAADLKGRKVGIPGFRSQMDVLFRKWLMTQGLKPSDVNGVEVSLPLMNDVLKSGNIDAAVVLEPFRSRIIDGGTGQTLANFVGDVDPDLSSAFWMASRDWAEKNPAIVQAFREAWVEGIAYVAKNPEDAKQIEFQYLKLNSPVTPSYSSSISSSDLDTFVSLMKETGMLQQGIDTQHAILK
jgi:NitT/TauT family transport system substrate-binding protein